MTFPVTLNLFLSMASETHHTPLRVFLCCNNTLDELTDWTLWADRVITF